jgi:hypothetical protein
MFIRDMSTRSKLRWGLSTGLALAALFAGIFTMPRGAAVRADNAIKLDLHDLPEAGLTLISAADQSFDQMLNDVPLLPELTPLREKLKPFSVFVMNGGAQTVVGYRIVWKITSGEGRGRTSTHDLLGAPSLMERWKQPPGPGGDPRQSVIRPGSSQLVSLLPVPRVAPNGGPMSFGWAGSFPGASPMLDTKSQGQSQNSSPADRVAASAARYIELGSRELAQSSKISVSIDGAVFEDGSFVGPDETGFFLHIQSEMTAKGDLYRELLDLLNAGKPDTDLDARLAEIAASKGSLSLNSTQPINTMALKACSHASSPAYGSTRGGRGPLIF